MLVYFSAENFKSIKEPIELDMRAAPRLRRLKSHVRTPAKDKKLKVLKSAVMYGANASGKSNIIKAINFARKMIVEHQAPDKPIDFEHFRLTAEPSEVSSFYFEFVVADDHMGFGVEFNGERILKESLLLLREQEELCLYNREYVSEEHYYIDGLLIVENLNDNEQVLTDKKELALLAKYTAKNRLFVCECEERNVFAKLKLLTSAICNAYNYFKCCLVIVFPGTKFAGIFDVINNKHGVIEQGLDKILCQFDTGLSGLKSEVIDIASFPQELIKELNTNLELGKSMQLQHNGKEYYALRAIEGELTMYSLQSVHKLLSGIEIQFDLENESDGTLRLLDILPLVLARASEIANRTFIIDEFDRSLHPNLAKSFVDLFLNSEHSQDNNQLIVSTHEAELLDNDLLRRDEIWFVQKEWDFSTKLYSLNDYSTRFDKDIHRAYLDGKFGAVPMLMENFRK